MKKISEIVIRKDSTIGKIQFDKEWFYAVTDIEDYLNEDLTGVETVTLKVMYDGNPVAYTMKCATWEDIERIRHKEPLEEFKGSVLRKK